MGNHKQLQLCWTMYAGDNNDGMPENSQLPGGGSRASWFSQGPTWLHGNAWTDVDDSNIRKGVLFKYNDSSGIYKCPADKSTVNDEGKIPRVRSVSMNMYMNFRSNPDDGDYNKCWHKVSESKTPPPRGFRIHRRTHQEHPAKCIRRKRRHMDTVRYAKWTWISFPATRPNKARSVIRRGHAESWRWIEKKTMETAAKPIPWLVLQPGQRGGDRDFSDSSMPSPDHPSEIKALQPGELSKSWRCDQLLPTQNRRPLVRMKGGRAPR
ncbi:MAG: hypothetical protein CM1200mP29_12240 [Verrucomicrobiota bacterium]|nr:MAG: hypothetical protein CM1200mP29_12240 [Verrucomicrobiota bacterium]